jgi:hypothetical protein
MATPFQPLSQTLNPKKARLLPTLLLVIGLCIALGAGAYGYLESRRTEQVVIALRPVPFGQQISADDLGTIELPLHRPAQLAGLGDANAIIGKWAAREIGPNDLFQANMLLDAAPDQPVYPSGQKLDKDTVPVPFSTATIGPLTYHDLVNVGYNSTNGDPQLCMANGGTVQGAPPVPLNEAPNEQTPQGRPFACRMLERVKVLYVDEAKGIAYLQMTPYQSHTIWALQAAGVAMWGERYGASSDALLAMDRLDASQITSEKLTMTVSDTLKLSNQTGPLNTIPGAASAIPGQPGVTNATSGDQRQPAAEPDTAK